MMDFNSSSVAVYMCKHLFLNGCLLSHHAQCRPHQ